MPTSVVDRAMSGPDPAVSGPDPAVAQPRMQGLVWAFAFDDEGRGELLADQEAASRVAAHAGRVWLHFNLTDTRARDWIATHAPICAGAREMLLSLDQRQQIATHDGEISGVVSDFHMEFDAGRTLEIGRLRFALSERLIVSARHHPLQSVERIRDELGQGRRIPEIGLFLELVVDGFLSATSETVAGFADELDGIEDAILGDGARVAEPRVGAIRRASLRLHREITPLQAALRRLGEAPADGPDLHRVVVRTAARLVSRLDAADHDLHTIGERCRLIRDELAALASAQTNRQLYSLSVLTALFLPATLVSGLFGMNAKDLPFLQTDGGFWYAAAIALTATCLVLAFLHRQGVLRSG